jgi:hypothetical protein
LLVAQKQERSFEHAAEGYSARMARRSDSSIQRRLVAGVLVLMSLSLLMGDDVLRTGYLLVVIVVWLVATQRVARQHGYQRRRLRRR